MLMRTYQRVQICKVDETIDETQMDHVENVLRIMEMCDNDIIIDEPKECRAEDSLEWSGNSKHFTEDITSMDCENDSERYVATVKILLPRVVADTSETKETQPMRG